MYQARTDRQTVIGSTGSFYRDALDAARSYVSETVTIDGAAFTLRRTAIVYDIRDSEHGILAARVDMRDGKIEIWEEPLAMGCVPGI